ncbi:DUF1302 domain-containing protein [Methylibium sp.]|uniref:DUF1302 domain-containing protein n=1 Tax=Methylibium sp. TaxID=2067992 RepID=UPI0033416527
MQENEQRSMAAKPRSACATKPIWQVRAVVAAAFVATGAHAFEVDTGNPDVAIRWDNTLKYNLGARLGSADGGLVNDDVPANVNNLNLDDGDRNFRRGVVSNRIDLLSEFDLAYRKNYGLRVSGAAWYDTVYNRRNDNDAPARANQSSVAYDEFTEATRKLHGRKAEFLDAFVYANFEQGNFRLGRHSLLYGETLFFGGNGIAYAQSPTDVIKLLAVPGSQFKEIILPVNQISGQYQATETVSLGAYYQFEWRKTRIPAAGSYLSAVDVFDDGAENFLFAEGLPVVAPRIGDRKAKDSGQYGAQLRIKPRSVDVEIGLYAARYNEKVFQAYLRPLGISDPTLPLNYQLVYPEDIKTYGVSLSTVVSDVNVAGEFSIRRNTPLVGGPVVDATLDGSCGIGTQACYAVGNSAHLNLSAIAFFNKNALWNQASLLAEIGWNRRTSITRNAAEIDPNTTRDAWGLRFVFEPQYFQVLPSLDVSVPIGLGYNPKGNSSVVTQFNGGVDNGGDLSIGVRGTYAQLWKFGFNYTNFFGARGGALGNDANLTFKQSLADRDFVTLTVQRTF